MSINKQEFLDNLIENNPNQPEFTQAVDEVAEYILPFIADNKRYEKDKLFERMVEPERVIMFRVPWVDDQGEVQINKGYRVEMNSAIGPYKGGLRFHPSVNLSILKFLAFEQTFKNSLTTLPLGGGKGGANFNPKGKSDAEIMRFCQSFMSELFRHIGANTDVPAGDIGVGAREIGYLFGMYKKLKNEYTGVLTGKSLSFGGSLIRTEATGYGLVYFVENMLKLTHDSINEKTVAISGSGNVAQYAAEKVLHFGGKVITLSDSDGYIYDKEGINEEKLQWVMQLKNEKRGRIKEYVQQFKNATYFEGKKPWNHFCDIALPCATQNELGQEDAETLVSNGVKVVAEGANMPCKPAAIKCFKENQILFAPGKASNAGGVATSGLEMTQNAMRYSWTQEDVDNKLKSIMQDIHHKCVEYGKEDDGSINYVKGANIAGFVKVAEAMLAQGIV